MSAVLENTFAPENFLSIVEKNIYPKFNEELETLMKYMTDKKVTFDKEVLKKTFFSSFIQKTNLRESLGLDPDYRRSIDIDDQTDFLEGELFKTFDSYMKYYSPVEISTEDLAICCRTGKIKDEGREYKLAKFLLGNEYVKEDEFNKYLDENLKGYNTNKFFGELVGSGKDTKRRIILSCNPMDFLLASENCGFSSCFAFGGMHVNATLAYARDAQTFVMFAPKAKSEVFPYYKVFRMWGFYINKQIIIGKTYGLNGKRDGQEHPVTNEILKHLTEIVSQNENLEPTWDIVKNFQMDSKFLKGCAHSSSGHDRYAVYFDTCTTALASHVSLKKERQSLEFRESSCLICGAATMQGKGLVCENCKPVGTCRHCGTAVYKTNNVIVNGVYYCKECAEKYETCSSCNNLHLKEDMKEVDGKKMCKGCFSDKYAVCTKCKQVHPKDKTVVHNGKRYCETCFSASFEKCSFCGVSSVKNRFKTISDSRICPTCYLNHTTECKVCGEKILKLEAVMTNDFRCPKCKAENKQ